VRYTVEIIILIIKDKSPRY